MFEFSSSTITVQQRGRWHQDPQAHRNQHEGDLVVRLVLKDAPLASRSTLVHTYGPGPDAMKDQKGSKVKFVLTNLGCSTPFATTLRNNGTCMVT